MSRYHLTSTSRALYRVFVAPTLAAPVHIQTPFLLPFSARLTLFPQTQIQTQPQTRSLYYKKDVKRHALSDYYTFDEAIEASHINYVDANGRFHANVHVHDALRSIDRVTQYLLFVNPGTTEKFGYPNPKDMPTCKVISKIYLRAHHERKLELERRTAMGKGVGPDSKSLELNWAMAENDLGHKLEKLKAFLKEGRKVEVMIGPKRKGRVATDKECEDVLKLLRATVEDIKGVAEAKEAEGAIGQIMTFVFEGRYVEEEKKEEEKKDKGEEKRKRREREEMKAERRKKAAEEDRRKKLIEEKLAAVGGG